MSVKNNLFMGAMVLAWLWMPQKGQGEETIITVKSGGKEVSISGKLSPNQIGDLIGKLLDQKNAGGLPADDPKIHKPAEPPDGLTEHGWYLGKDRAPVEEFLEKTKEELPNSFIKQEKWLKDRIKEGKLPEPKSEADWVAARHDMRLIWVRQITKDKSLGYASDDPLIYWVNYLAAQEFKKAASNSKDPILARAYAKGAELYFRARGITNSVFAPSSQPDPALEPKQELQLGGPYLPVPANHPKPSDLFGNPVVPFGKLTIDKDGNYKEEDGTGKVSEGIMKPPELGHPSGGQRIVYDRTQRRKSAEAWPETPQDPELAARPMPKPAAPVYVAPEPAPLYVPPEPAPVYVAPQPYPDPSWNGGGHHWIRDPRWNDVVGGPMKKVPTKRPRPGRW